MNAFIEPRHGYWILLAGPRSIASTALAMIARLAERGPLSILDCGRQFDASIVARAARGRIEVLDRIRIQRAFTCNEVANLLKRTPAGHAPVLILDLLNTFYDENVRMSRRRYLLENCLGHLARLSLGQGAVVIAYPPQPTSDSQSLFERIKLAAPEVLSVENPLPLSQQPSLF